MNGWQTLLACLLVAGASCYGVRLAAEERLEEERREREAPCDSPRFRDRPAAKVPWRCVREGKTERTNNPIPNYW